MTLLLARHAERKPPGLSIAVTRGMPPKPEPLEDGPERLRWFAEADTETRAANPGWYWFHNYDGRPRLFWDEIEVSEAEFRASSDKEAVEILDLHLTGQASVMELRPTKPSGC